MVELVIKIDKEDWKDINNIHFIREDLKFKIGKAIMNGTPLPKGHGRLADMDEAIKCIEEVNGEDAVWAIGLINWACSKRTILKADNSIHKTE